MEPTKQPVRNRTKKPADSKRSAGRGGTDDIILPVVRYHPSITQPSQPGRAQSSAQNTCQAQKPDKKTTNSVQGGRPDVLGKQFINYGSGCNMGRSAVGGVNAQSSQKTLSSAPGPGEFKLEGGELESSVVEEVEVLTRGQRENQAWYAWRKNRLTASNIHQITHSRFVGGTSSTPPAYLLAQITGQGPRVQTRAMRWGVDMESRAVKEYQALKSKLLGRTVVVQDSGLFIDPKRPWLAASPDGIVMDKLSGKRLLCLEVKCPFKHKDRTVAEACREDKNFCLQIQESPSQPPVYQLKQNHSYYSQIQCQLAVTGLKQAELVVFTLMETALVPVTFDPEFWGQVLPKLQMFYERGLHPHLEQTRQQDPAVMPEM